MFIYYGLAEAENIRAERKGEGRQTERNSIQFPLVAIRSRAFGAKVRTAVRSRNDEMSANVSMKSHQVAMRRTHKAQRIK